MDRSYEFLTYDVSERVAEITLNRPPVNAFSLVLLDEILDVLARARHDSSARAVILRSALPKIFCAGLDLDILLGQPMGEIRKFLEKLYIGLWDAQYALGKPSIAAVNGAARGGGMTLGISCDMLVASEKASFGYPELDSGLLPAIHFTHLPRIVGRYRAFELLFSGRSFGAEEARRLGLVAEVTAPDALWDRCREIAGGFASRAPNSMRQARAAFHRANDLDYRRGVAVAVEDFCNTAVTADAQEGLRAFVEKRQPVWPEPEER
ncbi:MAG: enoyl-CoA hydratase/isomerase family protein [Rhodobacteraceae bacterium]|nr:enoyl-CoA hydratase/isomerase family protein [Paracoccaceae bacterium]MBR9823592.1 enoyl-CoA hydratase/isomerase family protein [Paracoccaceae bacterium]